MIQYPLLAQMAGTNAVIAAVGWDAGSNATSADQEGVMQDQLFCRASHEACISGGPGMCLELTWVHCRVVDGLFFAGASCGRGLEDSGSSGAGG
jgi:hypothetical protein